MTQRFKVGIEFVVDAETKTQAENVIRKTLDETLKQTWYFVATKLDLDKEQVTTRGI